MPPRVSPHVLPLPDFQIPGADGAEPTTVSLPDGYAVYGPDMEPEGYTPDDRFTSEADRRAKSIIKNRGYITPEEAYSDEALQKALREKGYDLDADGKVQGKLDPAKIEAIKAEATAPLMERLTATEQRLQETTRKALLADVQGALASELVEDAFASPISGLPSTVEALIQNRVKSDDEGRFFVESAAGIPDYEVSKALLGIIQKDAPRLLRDKRQRGPGPGGDPARGGSGKIKTRAEFEALSPMDKMAFMDAGGRVTD